MKTYLRGYVQRDESDDDESGDKPLRIIAATAGRKGDGLDLTMDGADLGRFQANPVVGYGHSYWGRDSLPIGRADKTWIDGEKLMMDISFDADDDFARKVERKYRTKMMNAFSIGFDVWGIDQTTGVPEGWELYEVSAVPLPMDPNAVVESGRDSELALVRALTDLSHGTARTSGALTDATRALIRDAQAALGALLEPAHADTERAAAAAAAAQQAHQAALARLAGLR